MTYSQYKHHIESELNVLNWVIDEKIAQGLSYRQEARRHKELIRRARRMHRKSFLSKVMASVALF
jgi:hypothetical protein